MKNTLIIFILWNVLLPLFSEAQSDSDTLIVQQSCDTITQNHHFKYKIGVKIILGDAANYSMNEFDIPAFSGGVQFIKSFGSTPSSIETGLYMITKAVEDDYYTWEYFYNPYPIVTDSSLSLHAVHFYFYNLSIPVNYRYNTRYVYFSGGIMVDYLIGENNNGTQADLDSLQYDPDEIRKLNWGYNVAVGAERCFSKRMRFIAELRFAETLSSSKTTNGSFFFSPSYRSWGIAIGANYKLY